VDISTFDRMRIAAETVIDGVAHGDPARLWASFESAAATLAPLQLSDIEDDHLRTKLTGVQSAFRLAATPESFASMSDRARLLIAIDGVRLFLAATRAHGVADV
jgi:hypothetical protein